MLFLSFSREHLAQPACRGTSWGGFPFPGVYTRYADIFLPVMVPAHTEDSYDYGSSIRESRALSDKFDELKRQGLFLRSSPSFRKTDWIGDSSTGIPGVTLSGTGAFATLLKNPDTSTQFFIVRQNGSTSSYVGCRVLDL